MTETRVRPLTAVDVRAAYRRASEFVQADLAACPRPAQRLLEAVFTPSVHDGQGLARELGLHPGTLTTRLQRAGLPTPKVYVANARLVIAADLLALAWSGTQVANALEFSAPPHFGRSVRTVTGLSITLFKAQLGGYRMLERFRETLIWPHRERFDRCEQLLAPVAAPVKAGV